MDCSQISNKLQEQKRHQQFRSASMYTKSERGRGDEVAQWTHVDEAMATDSTNQPSQATMAGESSFSDYTSQHI
jgi:hypothetical protein